jgi:hypothetical protein
VGQGAQAAQTIRFERIPNGRRRISAGHGHVARLLSIQS